MKHVTLLLGIISFLITSCAEPLDALKVEKESLDLSDFDTPIQITVPKGTKALKGAEPEDMLGMFTIFSTKVKGANFALEVTCTTMGGMTLAEVLEEKGGELKDESGFVKTIEVNEDGFLFESKEINGDLNYSFIKLFVTEDAYMVVSPEPKSDGNTSLEEAKFMYSILNTK